MDEALFFLIFVDIIYSTQQFPTRL